MLPAEVAPRGDKDIAPRVGRPGWKVPYEAPRARLNGKIVPWRPLKIHHVLHKALAQAVKWNLIHRNQADAVKVPTPTPKEMHPLSAQEARRLLDAARGDHLEALYVLAVHTGMRRGELLGLKWDDVDLDNATVRVLRTLTRADNGRRLALGEPKTKKSRRTVRLSISKRTLDLHGS